MEEDEFIFAWFEEVFRSTTTVYHFLFRNFVFNCYYILYYFWVSPRMENEHAIRIYLYSFICNRLFLDQVYRYSWQVLLDICQIILMFQTSDDRSLPWALDYSSSMKLWRDVTPPPHHLTLIFDIWIDNQMHSWSMNCKITTSIRQYSNTQIIQFCMLRQRSTFRTKFKSYFHHFICRKHFTDGFFLKTFGKAVSYYLAANSCS